MYMNTDTPSPDHTESPESITARLQQIIGYDFTNTRLVEFLDRTGHPNQVEALTRKDLTPDLQRRIADRFRQIEIMFTDPVARAADVVQTRIQRESPTMKWVNLDLVVPRAIDKVEEEKAEKLDPHADIGYPSRPKKR